jgi:protein-S-isoprenylcysteine O-methyltransferase Ste14
MDTARYVVGVLVVTWLPPGLAWWFLIHPFLPFWRRMGARTTLWAMGAIFVGGVAVLLPLRDSLLARDLGTHPGLVALSAVLVAASFWIAVHRRRRLTTRILVGLPELEDEGGARSLLTDGIYARIRHPRYVEIALGTAGYALFSNWLGALVVGVATLPLLHLIVILEERELSQRFGDAWTRYASRVPRYVPRPWSSDSADSRS